MKCYYHFTKTAISISIVLYILFVMIAACSITKNVSTNNDMYDALLAKLDLMQFQKMQLNKMQFQKMQLNKMQFQKMQLNKMQLQQVDDLYLQQTLPFDMQSTYIRQLQFDESSNNHLASNKYGAIGLFQLTDIAYKDLQKHCNLKWPKNEIAIDIHKQYATQQLYMQRQHYLLKHYDCYKYIGTAITYNDIQYNLTMSSLFAASHLAGVKALSKWLQSNCTESIKDANGTSIATYAYKYHDTQL